MVHLIDKSALVAEIKKRLLPLVRDKHYDEWEEGRDSERIAILGIIDTLEVKEVDSLTDALIDKAWSWVENNILSSNQQDKSLLYYEQLKNYIKE